MKISSEKLDIKKISILSLSQFYGYGKNFYIGQLSINETLIALTA